MIHQRETNLAKHMVCSCPAWRHKWWQIESLMIVNTSVKPNSFLSCQILGVASMIYKNNEDQQVRESLIDVYN